MANELTEKERLERQRIVDAARATHSRGIADLEAYARGELTQEEVRARLRAYERQHSVLKALYAWVRKPKPMPGDEKHGGQAFKGFGEAYMGIGYFIAGLVLFASWGYCWITYGFLFGFGLGWLPSAILALIAVPLWPVFAILAIVFWTTVLAFVVGVFH